MDKMKSLIASMLKVGVIGFGGGNALIPVIEEEVVNEKKLISKEEYDKDIIAATLTPGALPVELASGVGLQVCGKKGMVVGGVMMALPGALFTVLLLAGLGHLNTVVLEQIQYASIGITAFIMCLLTEYIRGTLLTYRKSKKYIWILGVILGVFLLTAGKSLFDMFGIDKTPIFGVSTVDVLVTSFFAILFTECKFRWQNVIPTMMIGGLYLLCVGRAEIIKSDSIMWGLRALMVVLSIYGVCRGKERRKRTKKITMKPLIKKTTVWILFMVLLSMPAFIWVSRNVVMFDLHGLLSSFMSFGGGDAYLTIADGLFVPDYIAENEFYNHLVLIVNVLPGSILCKTLSGVGYAYGQALGGSIWAGSLLALAGFACSVAASCGVFHFIYHIYEWLERIQIFVIVKKSIRVIVSGLLMTVMAGLIKSGMATNQNDRLPWFSVLLLIFGIYGLNLFLFCKLKCNNIILIGASIILSLGLCNVIGV